MQHTTWTSVVWTLATLVFFAHNSRADNSPPLQPPVAAAERSFEFHYDFQLSQLTPGEEIRVWIPCPSESHWQKATLQAMELPLPTSRTTERKYGNRLMFASGTVPISGQLSFRIPWRIERSEISIATLKPAESAAETSKFLEPNRLVPTDGGIDAVLGNYRPAKEPLIRARQLYDIVDAHVRYSKDGTGWGDGNVEWVCHSRYGNCTDFHSLFIAMARAQGLPAKFEIGFPVPADHAGGSIAGYHCWAWVHIPESGWMPVDISEADKHPAMKDYYFGSLTADRVAFSVGRDLVLQPPQQGEPLNYFVYPYAEINGTPLQPSQVHLELSYSPVASTTAAP